MLHFLSLETPLLRATRSRAFIAVARAPGSAKTRESEAARDTLGFFQSLALSSSKSSSYTCRQAAEYYRGPKTTTWAQASLRGLPHASRRGTLFASSCGSGFWSWPLVPNSMWPRLPHHERPCKGRDYLRLPFGLQPIWCAPGIFLHNFACASFFRTCKDIPACERPSGREVSSATRQPLL